jgi:hypothetical protein
MRGIWLIALAGALAACTNGLAQRQAELTKWVGKPETDLIGLMGVPTRTYETGGMKFLTYDDRQTEVIPGPPYFGPGPVWYSSGFPPSIVTWECDTTFTVTGGVVRAFSLRGNACG